MKLRDLVMPHKLVESLDLNIKQGLRESVFIYVFNGHEPKFGNTIANIYTRELIDKFSSSADYIPAPTIHDIMRICNPKYIKELIPNESQYNISTERYWKMVTENLQAINGKKGLLISYEEPQEEPITPPRIIRTGTGRRIPLEEYYRGNIEPDPEVARDYDEEPPREGEF